MPSTGIIKNLNYPGSPTSGQAYITWDIQNEGQSGNCWTELYDTSMRIGIYEDTSYYYPNQMRAHDKIANVGPDGVIFKLTSGHFDEYNRMQDDEKFFYISGN